MKIRYKKKQLKISLVLGIVWLIFGILYLFVKDFSHWMDYGYLIISILYLSQYFYNYKYQYLTIENGVIYKSFFLSKKINLTEIKKIKKFAGDYIIKTDKTELTINTQIIDPNSLAELNAKLEKLNVEWA